MHLMFAENDIASKYLLAQKMHDYLEETSLYIFGTCLIAIVQMYQFQICDVYIISAKTNDLFAT